MIKKVNENKETVVVQKVTQDDVVFIPEVAKS